LKHTLGLEGQKDMADAALLCACRVNMGCPEFEFDEAVRVSNA
jgi:hypothetical protein